MVGLSDEDSIERDIHRGWLKSGLGDWDNDININKFGTRKKNISLSSLRELRIKLRQDIITYIHDFNGNDFEYFAFEMTHCLFEELFQSGFLKNGIKNGKIKLESIKIEWMQLCDDGKLLIDNKVTYVKLKEKHATDDEIKLHPLTKIFENDKSGKITIETNLSQKEVYIIYVNLLVWIKKICSKEKIQSYNPSLNILIKRPLG